jgi:hypothetical protein
MGLGGSSGLGTRGAVPRDASYQKMIGAPSATQPAANAAIPVATRSSLRAFIDSAPFVPATRGLFGAREWGDVQERHQVSGLIHLRASKECA